MSNQDLSAQATPGAAKSAGAVFPSVALADRRMIVVEVMLLLGVSLGQSAIYSMLSLWEKLTRPEQLNKQTTSINRSVTPNRELLDVCYQVAGIIFPVLPAFLALYLLWLAYGKGGRLIGFDLTKPWLNWGFGFVIALLIGVPGLAIYAGAKACGLNTSVSPANLTGHWYTFLIYLGLAAMNGILEEVIMIGYAFQRLATAGWGWLWIVLFSSLVRGSYHLYQGFGGFIGNAVMGVLFGVWFIKTRRVMPLVIAHFLLDAVVYLGYPLALPYLPWLK